MAPLAAAFRPPADHLAPLTGLRGVAAGWVAVCHLWSFAGSPVLAIGPFAFGPLFACGYFGVDLFFVLSGFLLGAPFIRARMHDRPAPSLRRFWRHRIRRVVPAYWSQLAVLALIAVAGGQALVPSHLATQALLVFNLFDHPTLNPVYWSLPVEWDFYLVLPLLVLGFGRGHRLPWLLFAAIGFAVAFRISCWWAIDSYGLDAVGYYRWVLQLPGRIDQFVFGIAAAWWVARGIRPAIAAALGAFGIVGVVVLVVLIAPRGDIPGNVVVPWLFWYMTALGAVFAALTAAAASAPRDWLGRWLSMRWLCFLGTISYSLYL
jgi:peptidoglycan/LPS O-acetylase OafA/YrhL